MSKSVILFILLLSTVSSYSQTVQQWARFHNGTGNGNDAGYTMDLDAIGNVYVAGTSYNTGGTGFDYIILKYDHAGNTLWSRSYNHSANDTDIASSMTIDGSGNIYVTGRSKGSGTGYDIATVKYNSAGVLQWTYRYNNSSVNLNDFPMRIKIDNSGNLYIAGQSYGTYNDCITIKLNPSTGDTLWVRKYTGYPSNDVYVTDLAIDNLGNPCVSATVSINIQTYLVFKYNTSGVLQWFDNLAGTGETWAGAITCDNIGNIYSAGGYRISCCYNSFTRKYNSVGATQWTNININSANPTRIVGTACDDSNNVIVVGYSSDYSGHIYIRKYGFFGESRWFVEFAPFAGSYEDGSSMVMGDSGTFYITGGQGTNGGDFMTLKYNRDGVQQWLRNYNQGGSVFDRGYAIKVDKGGNVYVTGESSGDIATIRYSQYLPLIPLLSSPVYNAANQPLSLNLVWYKSIAAANYRVQLATDSLFTNLVVNDSVLTDSIKAVSGLNNSTTYWWRVNARNAIGTSSYSQIWRFTTMAPLGINPIGIELPKEFKLYSNYPNPFNPQTKIRFSLPSNEFVKLAVYNSLGEQVEVLIKQTLNPGVYEYSWDASGYASGVYFYKIETATFVSVKKMILVK
ncbi:MAG: SBBP repeat-containing protein [Ignavibacteria bacterium]|nr:SBBP repeat-containing protein [Ignavibacteria bacterium]